MSVAVGDTVVAAAPVPRSALFGQRQAIEEVADFIRRGARLVTVTGPGGIGKTRVALEVARNLDHRVVFVPLAGADSDSVLVAIARAAAPAAVLGASPLGTVTSALTGIPTVLVLDTFEHLLGAAGIAATILDRCEDLQVLVTSRARLRLDGEQVVRLAGLPGGAEGPAVAMFQSRAAAIGGEIGDLGTLAEICTIIDGNPLAIELAAARTTVLSPAELLTRLRAGPLGVLARGSADIAPRHRSIRDTVAWSTVLLEPAAQDFFRACAIFPESFSLEAAEVVGGGNVLDCLAELVDLHLVEPVDGFAERRYRMLDTVREYGRELLSADPGAVAVRDRLVAWSVGFADRAGDGLVSADEREWIGRVGQELPVLRLALKALAEQGDAGRGARLVSRLGPYWTYRGPTWEGRRWLQTFLDDGHRGVTEELKVVATTWSYRLSIEEGDLAAVDLLEHARAAMGRDPPAVVAWLQATEHLAYGLTMRGDLARADDLTAEGIDVARTAGQPFWLAIFLQRRALSAQRHGQNERAIAYAKESVEVARSIGYDRIVAWSEQILAALDNEPGDEDAVRRAMLENLAAHRAAGDGRGAVSALGYLGAICKAEDYATAARWFGEGIEESQRIGYWHGEAFCLMGLAAAAADAHRFEEAKDMDAALTPYMTQLKVLIPPNFFAMYQSTMAKVAADIGRQVHTPAPLNEPSAWPDVRARALSLARELASEKAHAIAEPSPVPPTIASSLSRREVEVLAHIASGHTNAQIARDLYLSPKTIMHHSTSIYRKLEVRGRAEAVATAYRTGLLQTQ